MTRPTLHKKAGKIAGNLFHYWGAAGKIRGLMGTVTGQLPLSSAEAEGVALVFNRKDPKIPLFSVIDSMSRRKESLEGNDIADATEWLHIVVRIGNSEGFIGNRHIKTEGHVAVVQLDALPRHISFRCGG
jgi:hypothetical protein